MPSNRETRHRSTSPHRSLAAIAPVNVMPLPRGFRRADDRPNIYRARLSSALRFKRGFDLVAGFALLALIAPVFLLVCVLIPLDSPGPIFYSNKRIGLHGRIFRMLKFRTKSRDAHARRVHMVGGNDTSRLLFKHKSDPRVTRLGRFLRKYSLDELPQLINVLRGEMSLVGSRPLLKEDFENEGMQSALYWQWVRDRHLLWPGITGLWQVSGRNDLNFVESMHLDVHYVTHWTPWMDVKILLKTIPAVFAGRGAY
jgi:lipopolysaccharide/colanic/teichoic acid biosynthesis glycosyltransferase